MKFNLVVFNGDFYIKNTRSLLLPVTVAPSTGFIDYVENIGKYVEMNGRN